MDLGDYKLVTKRKVDFGALTRILAHGIRDDESFWEVGGAEALFELYRWMILSVTSAPYGAPLPRWSTPGRWGSFTLCASLSGSSATSVSRSDPLRGSAYPHPRNVKECGSRHWRQEMGRRFFHALFDDGMMVDWRREMRIDPRVPRPVPMLVYAPCPPPPPRATHYFLGREFGGWTQGYGDPTQGRHFPGEIDRLFALATPTRRLIPQLNSEHDDAHFLTAVLLSPTHAGWVASTEYGIDGSRWDGPSVTQKKGEPFSHFIYRAHDRIDALLTPICSKSKRPCAITRESASKQWSRDFGTECERQAD